MSPFFYLFPDDARRSLCLCFLHVCRYCCGGPEEEGRLLAPSPYHTPPALTPPLPKKALLFLQPCFTTVPCFPASRGGCFSVFLYGFLMHSSVKRERVVLRGLEGVCACLCDILRTCHLVDLEPVAPPPKK
eukprot:RCo053546